MEPTRLLSTRVYSSRHGARLIADVRQKVGGQAGRCYMSSVDSVAKAIIDAFDVDIQIFAGRLLRELRQSGFGAQFAAWAENNRVVFEVMLRAFSAAVQAAPRNHSVLAEAIRDQAARLPVELRRAILGDDPFSWPAASSDYPLAEPEFSRRYEEALQGLSDDQLRAVARLSQTRLKEWVYSPAAIRAVKLEQWSQEKTAGQQIAELISTAAPKVAELDASLNDAILNWRASQKWIKRSKRRQRELEAQLAARAGIELPNQPADASARDTSVKVWISVLVVIAVLVLVAILLQ